MAAVPGLSPSDDPRLEQRVELAPAVAKLAHEHLAVVLAEHRGRAMADRVGRDEAKREARILQPAGVRMLDLDEEATRGELRRGQHLRHRESRSDRDTVCLPLRIAYVLRPVPA